MEEEEDSDYWNCHLTTALHHQLGRLKHLVVGLPKDPVETLWWLLPTLWGGSQVAWRCVGPSGHQIMIDAWQGEKHDLPLNKFQCGLKRWFNINMCVKVVGFHTTFTHIFILNHRWITATRNLLFYERSERVVYYFIDINLKYENMGSKSKIQGGAGQIWSDSPHRLVTCQRQ